MTDSDHAIDVSGNFNNACRKPIDVQHLSLIKIDNSLSLPVARPSMGEIDLAGWLADNRETVETILYKRGALLFRGFELASEKDFGRVFDAVSNSRMSYIEGATPRKELDEKIYTSTSFPCDQHIALHNELSYVVTWPMKICFCCLKPSVEGGETPIADTRRVLQYIDGEIIERFRERGWMLVRNFREGFGLSWQAAFRMCERTAVEDYCREARINCEWLTGNRLRTTQIRPAVTTHPRTNELVWFNHIAFWHVSSLDPSTREILLKNFGEDALPYNTYYGDGTVIEESVITKVRQAYDHETMAFPWKSGDVLLLDNMLSAHGRRPFKGERKVVVAMGDPYSRSDF